MRVGIQSERRRAPGPRWNASRSMVNANDCEAMSLRPANAISTITIRNPSPGQYELVVDGIARPMTESQRKILAFQLVDSITR